MFNDTGQMGNVTVSNVIALALPVIITGNDNGPAMGSKVTVAQIRVTVKPVA